MLLKSPLNSHETISKFGTFGEGRISSKSWNKTTNVGMYRLVICDIAIEHGPVEIVDLPMNSMVIVHSYVNVYQRVTIQISIDNKVGFPQ